MTSKQLRHDLVIAELLRRLQDHAQVALQRPHLDVRNDEVRPSPDVARRCGCRTCPSAPPRPRSRSIRRRSPHWQRGSCGEADPARPGILSRGGQSLRRQARARARPADPPTPRNRAAGLEVNRRRHHGPEVTNCQRGRLGAIGGEGPIRDGKFTGIAPGTQLLHAAHNPFLPTLIEPAGHRCLLRRAT